MSLRAEFLPCGTRFALIGDMWREECEIQLLARRRAFYHRLSRLPARAAVYGPTVAALDDLAARLAQGGGA